MKFSPTHPENNERKGKDKGGNRKRKRKRVAFFSRRRGAHTSSHGATTTEADKLDARAKRNERGTNPRRHLGRTLRKRHVLHRVWSQSDRKLVAKDRSRRRVRRPCVEDVQFDSRRRRRRDGGTVPSPRGDASGKRANV